MECLSLDVKPSVVYQMVIGADLNGDHRVGFEGKLQSGRILAFIS